MFYLDRDVPLVRGHTIYIDSPWALTSISQAQFWQSFDLEQMGDGRVEGILSVDVSDWERQGILHRKQAMYCSKEQVRDEVWAQLKAGLDDAGIDVLDDANVLAWFLDPSIVYPNPTEATNLEPLLINTAGSWRDRPEAVTALENLFLASDYVRTHTDLATMEGANEAARRAVNGILDASGSSRSRCDVWPLREPAIFAPAKAIDRVLYALGRPPRPLVRIRDGNVDASPLLRAGAPWPSGWPPALLGAHLLQATRRRSTACARWRAAHRWWTPTRIPRSSRGAPPGGGRSRRAPLRLLG